MKYSYLSKEQIEDIFNMVAEGRTGKLRRIDIGRYGLVREVRENLSEDLIERAEMNEEIQFIYGL